MASSHLETLKQLAADPVVIAPSMLLLDFGHLADEIAQVEQAGARILHLDVMDGHFVDNLTYGLPLVAAFRRYSSLPIDAHLMISNPEQYVEQYVQAGATSVTIHREATDNPRGVLEQIKRAGGNAGIAVNPPTGIEQIDECLDLCDLVLVMSVTPGFGGQNFEPVALEKLAALKKKLGNDVILEVDGGVNLDTIAQCAQAGANWFVAGSAIFKTDSYTQSIARLTEAAAGQ
ncbi:MAG: ribulose-phosphate 3-epimerase [Pirellulales bacterium]